MCVVQPSSTCLIELMSQQPQAGDPLCLVVRDPVQLEPSNRLQNRRCKEHAAVSWLAVSLQSMVPRLHFSLVIRLFVSLTDLLAS